MQENILLLNSKSSICTMTLIVFWPSIQGLETVHPISSLLNPCVDDSCQRKGYK